MDKKGTEEKNQSYGLEAYTDYGNYVILVKSSQICQLLDMIKYKITALKLSQLLTDISQNL